MSPPAPASRPLQPDEGALFAELAGWEDLDAAKRLERIAESEIVLLLQLTGFDRATPEWQTVARALAEYGFAVFTGWGLTGVLRRMAANHAGGRGVIGISKIPEGVRLNRDEAQSLAADVVAVSIEAFRVKTLMDPRRTWQPRGGASLKTYFIGRALMELPDAYQRWRTDERPTVIDLRGVVVDDGRHTDDPSDRIIAAETLATVVATDPDPQAITMFELQRYGYSLVEIAEMLGTTEGAIRTRMTRLRARMRRTPGHR